MFESENTNNTGSVEKLFLVHVPALVAVLFSSEKEKGSPLTKNEVIEIRDNAHCIAMPLQVKKKVEESRGYIDIDPENVWMEWKKIKDELFDL